MLTKYYYNQARAKIAINKSAISKNTLLLIFWLVVMAVMYDQLDDENKCYQQNQAGSKWNTST